MNLLAELFRDSQHASMIGKIEQPPLSRGSRNKHRKPQQLSPSTWKLKKRKRAISNKSRKINQAKARM